MFVSSNRHKYSESQEILESFGISLGFFRSDLLEIQSDSVYEIAKNKALDAYAKCKKPVIIEDDALVVKSLSGFPGPYSSYVFKTIGNAGIVDLVKKSRAAHFSAVIAFCDKKKKPVLFEGITHGAISKKPKGRGWGYDPIFIPAGKTQTYAELEEKNAVSHRYRALAKFASWFANRQ
jgi:XTP/dITP diphosphohydrolase